MPKTVVTILHYKNDEMTNRCVDSVIRTTSSNNVDIVVVDNNSPNEYKRDGIIVVRNDNRDAVSGMNKCFYQALYNMGYNPDYIVHFDNDIICMDGWLEPIINLMESDSTIGIVGGKQWFEDMSQHRCVGMDLVGGILYANYPKETTDAIWIQGSFHVYRAEMMRMIGLHDTRYKVMSSDSDYCLHAKDRGWRVVFCAESSVIHIGGQSYNSVAHSWLEDNQNLIKKWSGMKFMSSMRDFPLEKKNNRYLCAKFSVMEDGNELA